MQKPYKTVHASVRPARVAVLVDIADEDWQHTCLRIIEFYSQLWGGAYNIIIPTNGETIDERFWAVLEVFDPDYVYRYRKSGEDLFLNHPDRFNTALETNVESLVSQGMAPDTARAEVIKGLRNARWDSNFEIDPRLHEDIKTRIAPFWFENRVVQSGTITAGRLPPWPLTNITKIAPSTNHPDRVAGGWPTQAVFLA